MQFDPNNAIVKLCVQGLEYEGLGQKERAMSYYCLAWEQATTDFEKFTAAHYLARHQTDPVKELEWNQLALQHAKLVDRDTMKQYYPSLYLNIVKSFEQIGDAHSAYDACELANSYTEFLADDGYGRMIKTGVKAALERLNTRLYGQSS
jgi:hypothetical protein